MTVVTLHILLVITVAGLVSSASDCEDLPCSHKCVVIAGKATCTCPDDLQLGQDQTTCQVPVSFLLAMFRGIKQLTEKTKDNDLSLILPVATKAFDFNFANKELYAYSNNSILRYSLKSLDEAPKVVVTPDSLVTSLATDWVRGDLYWICQQQSAIEAITSKGDRHRTVLTLDDANTQAKAGDPTPLRAKWRSLVIDPYVEKLFWTDGWVAYRADLEGQDLVTGLGGWRYVAAVSLDTRAQLVYVMGTREDKDQPMYIGRCRYDGSQPQKVATVPHPGSTVYGLGVLGRTVYWQTSYNAESVYKAELPASGADGQAAITLVEELNQVVYDFKVYHPDVQKTAK